MRAAASADNTIILNQRLNSLHWVQRRVCDRETRAVSYIQTSLLKMRAQWPCRSHQQPLHPYSLLQPSTNTRITATCPGHPATTSPSWMTCRPLSASNKVKPWYLVRSRTRFCEIFYFWDSELKILWDLLNSLMICRPFSLLFCFFLFINFFIGSIWV